MGRSSDRRVVAPAAAPRPFFLIRDEDASGVSGTGKVAQGYVMPGAGHLVLWFLRPPHSITIHPSVQAMIQVHGHQGRTRFFWGDTYEEIRDE